MFKRPIFFKAKCRLGIINPPVRHHEKNIGVEDGPDFVLNDKFLLSFQQNNDPELVFTKPEDAKSKYFQVIATQMVGLKELINKNFQPGSTPVVVGGDNSVTFGSLLALIERVQDIKKIGYIQFDSHGESNLAKTSPSGNFHGMYLRPFLDKFDIPEIEGLVPQKLDPEQVLFVGDQVLDGDEPDFFRRYNLKNINRQDYFQNQIVTQRKLKDFLNKFEYIHLNFDIDVLSQNVAGATGIPEDGKWGIDETLILLSIISQHPNLSIDLSEVNPHKPNMEKTVQTAQKILETLLK